MAFLLGLRLVFGTLASCLPFGCKVRTARRERTRERKKERKRRRWHGCFDQRQAMAVGERKKMASPLFRAQKGLSFVDVSNSSFLFCPRARKNRRSCFLSGRKEAHLNGRESSRCFWRVFAFPFFFFRRWRAWFFRREEQPEKNETLAVDLLSLVFFLSFFLSFSLPDRVPPSSSIVPNHIKNNNHTTGLPAGRRRRQAQNRARRQEGPRAGARGGVCSQGRGRQEVSDPRARVLRCRRVLGQGRWGRLFSAAPSRQRRVRLRKLHDSSLLDLRKKKGKRKKN